MLLKVHGCRRGVAHEFSSSLGISTRGCGSAPPPAQSISGARDLFEGDEGQVTLATFLDVPNLQDVSMGPQGFDEFVRQVGAPPALHAHSAAVRLDAVQPSSSRRIEING